MDCLESRLITGEISWLDMLVLVDLDLLADMARFDELFDVSPHAWPNIPISGHLDGLLLTRVSVFVQCLDRCLFKAGGKRRMVLAITSGG